MQLGSSLETAAPTACKPRRRFARPWQLHRLVLRRCKGSGAARPAETQANASPSLTDASYLLHHGVCLCTRGCSKWTEAVAGSGRGAPVSGCRRGVRSVKQT